ncbi:CinA family protein [Salana multivorans]
MSLAQQLVRRLAALDWTVAAGESITAGMVTAALGSVPGASMVLRGGIVAYSPAVKVSLLQVEAEAIERYGVVSEAVALAMASGARAAVGTELGLATTGVAGPGPADGVAAGIVCLAAVSPFGTAVRTWQLAGGRQLVRRSAADLVLGLGLSVLPRR